ncbi:MAG TPA: hypothetical protein VN408_17545 [Actinoplanes sp.]|nr:hypothetical protein [Actinoplanes sp.]
MTSPLYLVGNREIRLMLGDISRQRVYQLTARPDFPAPAASLCQGKVWRGEDVEAWISRRRRPPTPPSAAAPATPGQRQATPRPAPPPRPFIPTTVIPCCLHTLRYRVEPAGC